MEEDNPYLRRASKQRHGSLAEKKAAKRLGARLTFASGSLDFQKGDFSTRDFLFENKSTVARSLSVKLDWLEKISTEAHPKLLYPAVSIQFVTGDGSPRKDGAWVLIPEWAFKELVE